MVRRRNIGEIDFFDWHETIEIARTLHTFPMLMERLLGGATIYANKGHNSRDDEAWIEGGTGIRLVPRRRDNMAPNTLAETFALRRYRGRIEAVNSQSKAWGVQRLHARMHEGWLCKVLASLFALLCVNADWQSRYEM